MTEPHGSLPLDEIAALTGLEQLTRIMSGDWPQPTIGGSMNFRLAEVEDGRAVFEGEPTEAYYNPLGTVHGGWAATILDSALGCSVHTKLPAGLAYTTLEIKVNYIRPMFAHTGLVRAEGAVIHFGRTTATAEAKLTDHRGKLLAHGTTSCVIFPMRGG